MRLKGKPEPRDMGDEAGQDGEGLAGARGLATVEVYGHYGTCLNPAAPRATALPVQPHPGMEDATDTPKPSRFPAQIIPSGSLQPQEGGSGAGHPRAPGQSESRSCFCLMNCSSSLQQQIRAIKR